MKVKKVLCGLLAATQILAVCGCAKHSGVTTPATTEPPITTVIPTDPPITTAPPETTVPPVIDPPETTVPPTTEPDPTDPPITEPPTEPPAPTEPPVTEPPVTEHMHSYTANVVAPTCTNDGYTEHTCSCGDSYTDSKVEATGHNYKSKTTKPTCTKEGYTKHTCKNCGKSYKDATVPATGHNYSENVVAPTCTEDGYTEHTCSGCGDSYTTDLTPKGEHIYTKKVFAPTCTAEGYTDGVCICGAEQGSREEIVPAIGHSYTSEVIDSTCVADGYTKHTCVNCGDSYTTDPTPKGEHIWSEWNYSHEPIITRDCDICGKKEDDWTTLNFDVMLLAMDTGIYPEDMNEHAKQALMTIRKVYNDLPKDADDFDKICAAVDWLYDNCDYDYNALEIPYRSKAHSYVGAFEYGKAVCGGYAEAFWLFMSMFRVECEYIIGDVVNSRGQTELHAWNRVCLDGNWYYVDVTWGERWFMLSEEEFGRDHILEETGICTQSLPDEFQLRRLCSRYHVESENVLEDSSLLCEKMRQDLLAGKTELAYIVVGTCETRYHIRDVLTNDEYNSIGDKWSGYTVSYTQKGDYMLVLYRSG